MKTASVAITFAEGKCRRRVAIKMPPSLRLLRSNPVNSSEPRIARARRRPVVAIAVCGSRSARSPAGPSANPHLDGASAAALKRIARLGGQSGPEAVARDAAAAPEAVADLPRAVLARARRAEG